MADVNERWSAAGSSAGTGSEGWSQQRSDFVGRVREKAAAQLSNQKDKATDKLGSVVQAVRHTTDDLREQNHETVAHYVSQAADQIERFSQRLREKSVEELLDDVQRLARRQPAVFIGSAFALGVLGARFLKSSADDGRSQATPAARDWPVGPAAVPARATPPAPASSPAARADFAASTASSTDDASSTGAAGAAAPGARTPRGTTEGAHRSSPSAPPRGGRGTSGKAGS